MMLPSSPVQGLGPDDVICYAWGAGDLRPAPPTFDVPAGMEPIAPAWVVFVEPEGTSSLPFLWARAFGLTDDERSRRDAERREREWVDREAAAEVALRERAEADRAAALRARPVVVGWLRSVGVPDWAEDIAGTESLATLHEVLEDLNFPVIRALLREHDLGTARDKVGAVRTLMEYAARTEP